MKLSDEELRAVLERAEEIERATRHGGAWNAEVAAVLSAGEEIGLSREAIQRALAERVGIPVAPPAAGSMVWARSADGQYYIADVLASTDAEAHVRFLRGGESRVALDAIRGAALLPGERVMVEWPRWGAYQCSVVSYDEMHQEVKLSDGWFTKTFPISDVWITPPRAVSPGRRSGVAWIVAGSGTIGALIGAALTALLR
jgi:hypothetical protein